MKIRKWTSLKIVADKILRDPMFIGLNYETIVDYFIDFMTIVGTPDLFEETITEEPIQISNYRARIPDGFISEVQMSVDKKMVRMATDTYSAYYENIDTNLNDDALKDVIELTYRIKGDYIYLSQKTGELILVYKKIMTQTDPDSDDFGYPLMPDDPIFIIALQRYIELEFLKMLFRAGKINSQILSLAQQDYAWAVGRYETHSRRLTLGEMESISKLFRSIVTRNNEFNTRFKNLGVR